LDYLPESPGLPAIGVDRNSNDVLYNKYYMEDRGWQDFGFGRLMIRIGVGHPPSTVPEPEEPYIPQHFRVAQNFPNPFNGMSLIPIDLPISSDIKFDVYGIDGRHFLTNNLGYFNAGCVRVPLRADQLPAGIYLIQVTAGTESKIIKIVLTK